MEFKGINVGTEEQPMHMKRRWWREPQMQEGERPAEACRREATGNLAFAVGGEGRDDHEVRAATEEVLADDDFESDGRRLVDSAAAWDAQAADIEQLTKEIESGEVTGPEPMRWAYEEISQQRADLDVYLEPEPVEFTDTTNFTGDGPGMSSGPVKTLSVVVDNPAGQHQSRLTAYLDHHDENRPYAFETQAGHVNAEATWQGWNPDVDLDVVKELDPLEDPATQYHAAWEAFQEWTDHFPGKHQGAAKRGAVQQQVALEQITTTNGSPGPGLS